MNKIKLQILGISIFFIGACTQKNTDFFPTENNTALENLKGRTLKYTILLSSAANSADSVFSTQGAIASLAMNDSIYYDTADVNGMLTFGHLAAGNIVVRIEDSLFYTYNYIVNLNADTSTNFDTQNYRNVSTIVRLLPKAKLISGQLNGIIQADTNLQISGLETINRNLLIHVQLSDSTQKQFAEIAQGQTILDAWFEFPAIYTQAINSQFILNLPVVNKGLEWLINADAFTGDFVNAAADTTTMLYQAATQKVKIYPFSQSACKIIYKASKK